MKEEKKSGIRFGYKLKDVKTYFSLFYFKAKNEVMKISISTYLYFLSIYRICSLALFPFYKEILLRLFFFCQHNSHFLFVVSNKHNNNNNVN